MAEPQLRIRRRNLPHWCLDGSIYFITFRAASQVLSIDERRLVLQHIKGGHEKFYYLAATVVMPDHVHLLLIPKEPYSLSRIMKGIKGVTARKINLARGTAGKIWQDECWDRIVRDDKEFEEKLQYMADNPVKAGLATSIEEYDSWYCNLGFLDGTTDKNVCATKLALVREDTDKNVCATSSAIAANDDATDKNVCATSSAIAANDGATDKNVCATRLALVREDTDKNVCATSSAIAANDDATDKNVCATGWQKEVKPEVAHLLAGYPVIVELPVCWGEMDSYRHVNNVVYFRYFENARLEYFRRLDWHLYEKETGIGPILQSTQARFRRALTYPDTIAVSARAVNIEGDRFTLEHVIVSYEQAAVVTEGQGTVVTFHYANGQKVPVPEEICRRIAALEATAK
jgi:YbgC/YbaW family acyl-CoA thioester hydrolase